MFGETSSSRAPPSKGVPQGSIQGQILFSQYVELPLGAIITKHKLHFQCYDDSIQIYRGLFLQNLGRIFSKIVLKIKIFFPT